MGIACTKDLSITIQPSVIPEVIAYWKLEEAAAPYVEEVDDGLYNLAGTAGTGPGIIGNGYPLSAGWIQPSIVGGKLGLSGKSWTLRFWYKPETNRDTPVVSWTSGTGECELLVSGNIQLKLTMAFGVVKTVSTPIGTLGNWHRVVAYYELGVGGGIKVDNNAFATFADATVLNSNVLNIRIGESTFSAVTEYVDEVGIWDRLLTTDELLDDWNGGAGKTYPDVP